MMQQQVYQWAKSWGLGVTAYHLYHAPRRLVREYWRDGMWNRAATQWAQWQMEKAATQLKPIDPRQGSSLEIHFLSGRRFWYQTCFCFYSLMQQTDLNLRPVIYDDGTLAEKHQEYIYTLFWNAKIIPACDSLTRLDEVLPVERFPYLRSRRLTYPNLRKLTDIHIHTQDWTLVLDSDMLFFRPPTQLLQWLQQPENPCYMVDVDTAYGYSESLMRSLAQATIPERINVGICGLPSHHLDWDELEFWCKTLIEQEGNHYYQEQAIAAMLMARQPCTVVPAEDYMVMPSEQEVRHPQAILHHYVADSKQWYFRHAWKQIC